MKERLKLIVNDAKELTPTRKEKDLNGVTYIPRYIISNYMRVIGGLGFTIIGLICSSDQVAGMECKNGIKIYIPHVIEDLFRTNSQQNLNDAHYGENAELEEDENYGINEAYWDLSDLDLLGLINIIDDKWLYMSDDKPFNSDGRRYVFDGMRKHKWNINDIKNLPDGMEFDENGWEIIE